MEGGGGGGTEKQPTNQIMGRIRDSVKTSVSPRVIGETASRRMISAKAGRSKANSRHLQNRSTSILVIGSEKSSTGLVAAVVATFSRQVLKQRLKAVATCKPQGNWHPKRSPFHLETPVTWKQTFSAAAPPRPSRTIANSR
ncbi:hypothetical protein Pla100_16230 [Neorhodopirellula pilleata]|uniref:Uncharacterized protein n=1 Tax=Neorhodopirellula pilleata TaxID=2714738 RepID=A0A5C6AQW9_9BACT|nr:hypothetical protein Pla100_16230 [Neorhodopirellula pilleata]